VSDNKCNAEAPRAPRQTPRVEKKDLDAAAEYFVIKISFCLLGVFLGALGASALHLKFEILKCRSVAFHDKPVNDSPDDA
jgi:hypothetical protein